MKKFLSVSLVLVSFLTMFVSGYNLERDDAGYVPGDVNLLGVEKHKISGAAGGSTTGQVAKSADVSTLVSTTTVLPVLLYGLVISSNSATAYSPGVDYVILRDTYVVNTTGEAQFVIGLSTTNSTIASSLAPFTWEWYPKVPIKFDYGILATPSSANWGLTILFRYQDTIKKSR